VTIAYADMDLTSSYSAADTAIIIQFNEPYASLDTIDLTLSYIRDWSDTGTDDKELQFTTYMLADYDKDLQVDVTDLIQFIDAWNVDDVSYELGPTSGSMPNLIPDVDGSFTLIDALTFSRMWYWSNQTSGGFMALTDIIGAPIDIEQVGNQIILQLPDATIASEIAIQYPVEDIEFIYQSNSLDNEIIASRKFEDEMVYMQLNGFVKGLNQNIDKQLTININGSAHQDFPLMIKYRLSGNDGKTITQGSHYLKFIPIPDEFSLHQNYPNPFNPVTTIQYDIPIDSEVLLLVYDIQGRLVKTLVNTNQSAGYKSIRWNGMNDLGQSVSAGMYFYHLQAVGYSKVRKMVLLK
jgi:hypothetical protein